MGVFTKSLVASHISFLGLALMLVASCASPSSPSSSPTASSSTYTVTYNGNGSTSGSVPVDKNTYSSGSTVTVLGNTGTLAKTGFTFVGWNTNSDGSGITYPSGVTFTIGSANVSLYALWTQSPTFTVSYNGNGFSLGTVPLDGNNYVAGTKVTVLGNTGGLTKTGYLFSGWNTQTNGQGASYSVGSTFAMPSSNVVLYAIWLPTFTVTYDGNGSTSGTVPVDSNLYIQGSTVTALANTGNLAKTGYTFVGWNTAANGSGTAQLVGSTFVMGTSNVTLYAQWSNAPTYTVTYNSNGATGGSVPVNSNNYLAGATVTVASNPGNLVKVGYVLTGWNTQSNDLGTTYSFGGTFSIGTTSVILYPVWTRTYTVSYNGNGATGGAVPSDSNNYQSGNIVTVFGNTGNLTQANYVFSGWNTASGGGGSSYASGSTFSMGSSNVTLYAQWTPTYTVTYSGNGATSGSVPVDSNNYLSGTTVTVLGNTGSMTLSGYSFNGWNTASTGTGTAYSAGSTLTMGSTNLTLYAQWTNQTGVSVTITTPGVYTISITGTASMQYNTQYPFSSTYTGNPVSYQWFLDGTPLSGATSSSLNVTPTISTFTYGSNILSLAITDSNGVIYSGTFACNVTN